jgi:hypothetical protein
LGGASESSWHKFGGGQCRFSVGSDAFRTGNPETQGLLLKIEASGYASTLSRIIGADEIDPSIEIALRPAKPLQVAILNPDGSPATDAGVGLASGRMMTITAGRINAEEGNIHILRSNSKGVVAISQDDSIAVVVALNSQGFVMKPMSVLNAEPVMRLEKYGILQGRWTREGLPVAEKKLILGFSSMGAGIALDSSMTTTQTEADGSYKFPILPPGKYHVMAPMDRVTEMLGETQVQPGETTAFDIVK